MIAKVVMLGFVAALIAGTISGLPAGPLPGIALGSALLLSVERVIAFFAAWMLVVVIVAHSLEDRLPTEISGRGVRYANAEAVETKQEKAEQAAWRHDIEIAQLREAVVGLERRIGDSPERIE